MTDFHKALSSEFDPDAIEWVIDHAKSALGVDELPPSLDEPDTAIVMGVQPSTVQVWRCTGGRRIQFVKTGRTARNNTASVLRVMLESGDNILEARKAS